MKPLSLQARTGVFLAVCGLVLLGGLEVLLFRQWQAEVLSEFDQSILARAQALGTLMSFDGKAIRLDFADEASPEYSQASNPAYFQIWANSGVASSAPLERSISLGDGSLPRKTGPLDAPAFFDADGPGGRPLRCAGVLVPVDLHAGLRAASDTESDSYSWTEVIVGVGRERMEDRKHQLRATMILAYVVLGLAYLASIVAAMWLLRRSLGGVTARLRTARATPLEPILWDERTPSELRPLTDALDESRADARQLVERERLLLASLAHEIRTPIAEVLTTTEVALDGPGRNGTERSALEACRDVAREMRLTVDRLLELARVRSNASRLTRSRLDLAQEWREAVEKCAALAAERRVRLLGPAQQIVEAVADADAVRVILGVLAGNAAGHTPEGAAAVCSIVLVPTGVRLEVSNPAPHLGEADLEMLCDPMWSGPSAPGGHHGHGLGLYLASEVAESSDLDLHFELREGMLRIALHLPGAAGGDACRPGRGELAG